ncbi:MAG: hypothetical protein IRZ31_20405 [Thermogemmatispora sp.]|uniref:hypothetical protein n=1 Tax=Thermogemmatispora sp. TaxID=1968838 RepID=UPI0026292725|nr:hypothetical protein [Thermogemmatispora sp.]MBX5459262.1 hypothetical protein [Thermogemmatispora sp.]
MLDMVLSVMLAIVLVGAVVSVIGMVVTLVRFDRQVSATERAMSADIQEELTELARALARKPGEQDTEASS